MTSFTANVKPIAGLRETRAAKQAFDAPNRQQLLIFHARLQRTAERPKLFVQAETMTEDNDMRIGNRSSFIPAITEEYVEEIYSDEGALVHVQDDYEPEDYTLPIRILEDAEALEEMLDSVHKNAEQYYHSFFSSEIGGVTTNPAFMLIPMDDHLVHRGHGVFDTALISSGHAYMLDEHLDRFRISAKKAAIPLPASIEQLKRTILETVAASRKYDGIVRFWLGAGRGDFDISPKGTYGSTFYCMMTTMKMGTPTFHPGSTYLEGRKVKISDIPIKDPYFATLKSVNYLPNALACMDGESDKLDYGVFVDEEGFIAEGPNMNMMILTQEGELLIPPFKQTLPGLTMRRLMELIPQQLEELKKDTSDNLQSMSQRKFTKWDVYNCKEAMLVGSTTIVTSIVHFNGKDIGDNAYGDEPGIVSLVLRAMLINDMTPGKGPPEVFTEIPYGIMTNMQ